MTDPNNNADNRAVAFLGGMGGLRNKGEPELAVSVARLMLETSKTSDPAFFAREIARAAQAWADSAEHKPRLAASAAQRVIDGPVAPGQGRLATQEELPRQENRRAAAPKPRGP